MLPFSFSFFFFCFYSRLAPPRVNTYIFLSLSSSLQGKKRRLIFLSLQEDIFSRLLLHIFIYLYISIYIEGFPLQRKDIREEAENKKSKGRRRTYYIAAIIGFPVQNYFFRLLLSLLLLHSPSFIRSFFFHLPLRLFLFQRFYYYYWPSFSWSASLFIILLSPLIFFFFVVFLAILDSLYFFTKLYRHTSLSTYIDIFVYISIYLDFFSFLLLVYQVTHHYIYININIALYLFFSIGFCFVSFFLSLSLSTYLYLSFSIHLYLVSVRLHLSIYIFAPGKL